MDPIVRETLQQQHGLQIEERIGRGGFSEVNRARSAGGLECAIKVSLDRIRNLDGKLQQELQALEAVKGLTGHPHLVTLMDWWLMHGYLVTRWELATDGNLLDLAKQRGGKLAGKVLCPYMVEAAGAIDFLNGQGLYHRDVKPANLLLFHGHVKLADLGLAKFAGASSATHTGSGTLGYKPPETYSVALHARAWPSRRSPCPPSAPWRDALGRVRKSANGGRPSRPRRSVALHARACRSTTLQEPNPAWPTRPARNCCPTWPPSRRKLYPAAPLSPRAFSHYSSALTPLLPLRSHSSLLFSLARGRTPRRDGAGRGRSSWARGWARQASPRVHAGTPFALALAAWRSSASVAWSPRSLRHERVSGTRRLAAVRRLPWRQRLYQQHRPACGPARPAPPCR
ncbi:MAG: protein kinase [Pirellulales bacterium]|nr:protein kinase [Pirellulales bacterium]